MKKSMEETDSYTQIKPCFLKTLGTSKKVLYVKGI